MSLDVYVGSCFAFAGAASVLDYNILVVGLF